MSNSVPAAYNPVTSSALLETTTGAGARGLRRRVGHRPKASRIGARPAAESHCRAPTDRRGKSFEYQAEIVVFSSITPAAAFNAAVSACRPSALTCSR
jgi:hypothetical protein